MNLTPTDINTLAVLIAKCINEDDDMKNTDMLALLNAIAQNLRTYIAVTVTDEIKRFPSGRGPLNPNPNRNGNNLTNK